MSFRRGACPALSAPMQTGDGLLVRLATAGARLTPSQMIALCKAAARHGNGVVEITARGNFQIRGLTPDSATALAEDIASMQLDLRDGVPVETNPLAGLDPSETANAAPIAAAIRDAVDACDLKQRLAPKVSVVVDGGGAIALPEVAADIRFDALTATEWRVSLGGNAANARVLGVCGTDDASAIALRLLECIAAQGPEARGRDLEPADIKALLSQSMAGQLPMASSPPHPAASRPPCPRGGEVESRRLHGVSSPLGERTRAERAGEGVQAIALTGDRFALPVALPFGSVRTGDLIAFLNVVGSSPADEIRLAAGRRLLVLCASAGSASGIRDAARAAGFVIDADDPRTRIFACPGSAGCASGHFAAREIAAAVARQIAGTPATDRTLHVSGCPKGCAHPARTDLVLVGTDEGPMLVEDGTARDDGVAFEDHDIARRLANRLMAGDRGGDRATPAAPHPAPAFAGE